MAQATPPPAALAAAALGRAVGKVGVVASAADQRVIARSGIQDVVARGAGGGSGAVAPGRTFTSTNGRFHRCVQGCGAAGLIFCCDQATAARANAAVASTTGKPT